MSILLITLALFVPLQDGEEPTQDDIETWIGQLAADYQQERLAAYDKLEKAGKAAEGPLCEAIDNEDFRIQRACLELLTKLKSKKVVDEAATIFDETDDATVRDRAFAYLQMCGQDAEDALIDALDREEDEYRLGALKTLSEFKSQKCAERVADIYDTEPAGEIKNLAFKCLQQIGAAAKPYLLKLLGSQDSTVRKGALEGLMNIKADDDDAVKAVSDLFQKETDEVVQRIAFKYLENKGKRAEPAFLVGLKSGVAAIRLSSIEGLTTIKSDKALDHIADLFDNDKDDQVRVRALEYLKALGLKSEDRLLGALDNENPKVVLMAIEGLGAIKSSKPLPRISKLYRENPDAEVHRVAFEYLKNVGKPAEDDLIHALKDTVPEIREQAIKALGRIRSEKAIEPLIEILTELSPTLRDAARDSLVHIGQKAVDAVKKAAEDGKVRKKISELIVQLHEQEQVERILDRLITDQGGTGFYEGQFKELEDYGVEKAVPILLKILEPKYELRLPEKKGDVFLYERYMRELAVMAVGELGDKEALPKLKAMLKDRSHLIGDDMYEEIVIACYRLGDKKPFEEFVKDMKDKIKEDLEGDFKSYDRMFALAMVQNRIGEREMAIKTYLELKKVIEENKEEESSRLYDAVNYNIACLHALAGRTKEALLALERAIKAGFKDRQWIKMDSDLESLRKEKEFKDMMSNDKLFEKTDD